MPEFKFFIIPRARTGGTLLATMLNAHPKITMGYEIYPNLLIGSDGDPFDCEALLTNLESNRHRDNEQWVKALHKDNFRVFASRARRSGIEPSTLIDSLNALQSQGVTLNEFSGRMDFIELLLKWQAEAASKPFVGAKMRVDPESLHKRHPEAVFLMVLRDGRDVLDSRMRVGDFNTSPEECAQEWCDSINDFEQFVSHSNANSFIVSYEQLVMNPEQVLTKLLNQTGLDFHQNMIEFEKELQPLFSNAHGHLSAKQLSAGLNAESIGRWKNGLTSQQLEDFMSVANDQMTRFGYDL